MPKRPGRVTDPAASAERAALAGPAASSLRATDPGARAAALERLEELFVSRASGACETDPEVARVVVPEARLALAHPDPEVRVTGVEALRLVACDAHEGVVDLAALLADPAPAVRIAALGALCEFGEVGARVSAAVAARLKEASSPEERAEAAYALANRTAAAEHHRALIEALVRDVAEVQAGAASALAHVLAHGDDEERQRVSSALRRLSPGG